jgi:UDP-N-acetylmuramoylalanine--D-glutamate ligase
MTERFNNPQIILGLGHTGYSVLLYLLRKGYAQKEIKICDTRANPPYKVKVESEYPDVILHCGATLSEEILLTAERVIISPGLSLHDPAIQAVRELKIPLIGDIQLFSNEVKDVPIVGITGTNAKGTVTTMLTAMAEQAGLIVEMGGNIGIPVLDLLLKPKPDLYILELSSFQLETTHFLPLKAATILNISPDHLDHHKDMDEYKAAKQRIYRQAENCVFNRADEAICPLNAPLIKGVPEGRGITSSDRMQIPPNPPLSRGELDIRKFSTFALDVPLSDNDFGTQTIEQTLWLTQGKKPLLKATELQIPGSHNIENALAALALAKTIDLPLEACLNALRVYKGLPHRCQLVRTYRGVRWYNDSKATNIGSTMAALKGFQTDQHKKLFLIAGGDAKGADVGLLSELMASEVDTVFLYGKDAPLLQEAWQKIVNIIRVIDLKNAVEQAAEKISEGDVILLSPACSSLDMFKNFEERGELFESLVNAL